MGSQLLNPAHANNGLGLSLLEYDENYLLF